jgi:hypothetical protein
MGTPKTTIDRKLADFISRQHVFFVATAPLSAEGHVNLSPKGLDSFRILDDTQVAYADYVGSGAETIAHLKENGRIVVMFCAFEGAPQILRLHGRGDVVQAGHPEFASLIEGFPTAAGIRAIIRIQCTRISTSCGFGVPLMTFERPRTQLDDWCEQKGPEKLRDYQVQKNLVSLDGLPAVDQDLLQKSADS